MLHRCRSDSVQLFYLIARILHSTYIAYRISEGDSQAHQIETVPPILPSEQEPVLPQIYTFPLLAARPQAVTSLTLYSTTTGLPGSSTKRPDPTYTLSSNTASSGPPASNDTTVTTPRLANHLLQHP